MKYWITLIYLACLSKNVSGSTQQTRWIREIQNSKKDANLLPQPHVRYGTQTLLAVRVSSPNEKPEDSEEDLHQVLFGKGSGTSDGLSVSEQIRAITHGQLVYKPATGPHIRNGVIDIKITSTVKGSSVIDVLIPEMIATLRITLGTRKLDHVANRIMFCLPNGSLKEGRDWYAFTHIFGQMSYFTNSACTKLPTIIHELGHGVGFHHSSADDDEYGDMTCFMGGAAQRRVKKAFNGHKHWISGWFVDRMKSIEPVEEGSVYVRLVSFVDYQHVAMFRDDVVLVRVGALLYLQYNRAKGYNADTSSPDAVTITSSSTSSARSYAVAALVDREIYRYIDSLGNHIIIEVCALHNVPVSLDYAIIHVYVDDGNHTSCFVDSPPKHTPIIFRDSTKIFRWPTWWEKVSQTIQSSLVLTILAIATFVSLAILLLCLISLCCSTRRSQK